MNHSFEVYHNKSIVFFSDDHWLHPLFAFEKFLKQSGLKPGNLLVKDKIVGKAAALVLVYLGIENIHANTLSRLALTVLENWKVNFSYDLLVNRIDCQTENLLMQQNDPAESYNFLKERIKSKPSMDT
jgi:zinc transport system ATP-binding protein